MTDMPARYQMQTVSPIEFHVIDTKVRQIVTSTVDRQTAVELVFALNNGEPVPPAPAMAKITHRDVARPAQGETADDRLRRLAAKAVIEGCRVIVPATGWIETVGVTSGSHAGMVYLVDLGERTCTCPAQTLCKHIAVSLITFDLLPDPTGPAAVQIAA